MTDSLECLPQDDICHCGNRIGNHTDYEMWKCLQRYSRFTRELSNLYDEVNTSTTKGE